MNKPAHDSALLIKPGLMLAIVVMSVFSLLVTWWVEQFAREIFRVW